MLQDRTAAEIMSALWVAKGNGIPFVYDDGGRKAAGFKGRTGDCVIRAIAIATQLPYKQVYSDLRSLVKASGADGRWLTMHHGVPVDIFSGYLGEMGWRRVAAMGHRTGIKIHLRKSELPSGRLVVRVSKHVVAVVDGVLHDTYDSSRFGTRGVYAYWTKEG